ncbi:acetate uptake transporter [Streptacidiphilus fuscans]|uniref:Acetate uptake transporter n=1 Tax=Streptacidiphilus fuscans TaxID=2789292 RepID=A0A931B5C8_9ACTN|nr:acetate uptake transporter [Streptacidiphilus fuscans]MBF9069712.1 acetate uptake transporter [Streptacidiphilus fuscans]
MSNETPTASSGSSSSPLTASTPTPAYADPAPLGLAGFALTTLVLSFVNANIIKEPGAILVVLGLAAFYGGLAQFVAGVLEWRRGNTFGLMAFCSYGAFWLSYWWIITNVKLTTGDIHQAIGLYLIGWCIISAYLTLAALRTNLAVVVVLALLTLAFLFLGIGWFQNGVPAPDTMIKVGGWIGIFTAAAAFYASAATVVNAQHKRTVLPIPPLER